MIFSTAFIYFFLTRIVRTGFPRIGDTSPLIAFETRGNPQAEARITGLNRTTHTKQRRSPVFLLSALGVSVLGVGIIEGIAQGTASIMKLFSGALSDVAGRRKPLVLLGYGLAP
jgi:hypothetical protein